MYVVSLTPEDYLQKTHFTTIETTKEQSKAIQIDKSEIQPTLTTLRRMGYDPLLIRITQSTFTTKL